MNDKKRIRVLVVDDSPTARLLQAQILRGDSGIEVAGEAENGAEAVAMTLRLRPDVVTMDMHMPQMDGFEATRLIMAEAPTPIVIVSASLDPREVEASMHALRAGALTVLAKPLGPGSPQFEESSRLFLQTVKAMAAVKVVRHWNGQPPAPAPPRPPSAQKRGRGEIVAIAVSTGGPSALSRLMADMPRDLRVPILVVQHMAPGFIEGFAAWLDKASPLKVKVAEQGETLAARTVYLAPDASHLGVAGRANVLLSSAPPIEGFRPSGTFLFDSVAKAFGSSAVALIMTGMGHDGVDGLRAVQAAGGRVLAQDEGSSVVFGMPGAAVAAGLVDHVLPLASLAWRLKGELI